MRRIDVWVGRCAAIVGFVYVSLRSPIDGGVERRVRRPAAATVVRCPERRRLRGAAIAALTCVAAIAAALFVTIHAISVGPDDWALPLASVLLRQ